MSFQNKLVRKKPFWLTKSYVWVHIIPSERDVSNSGWQGHFGGVGIADSDWPEGQLWSEGIADSDWLSGLFGGEGFADGEDGERDGWEIQGGLEGGLVEVADYQASKAEVDGLETHRLE